jgi:hypothetical protein
MYPATHDLTFGNEFSPNVDFAISSGTESADFIMLVRYLWCFVYILLLLALR